MPITPTDAAGTLASALVSAGIAGISAPQLALGVASGVSGWVSSLVVTTIDTGTLGSGTGQSPFVVPQPLLLTGLTAGLAIFAGPMLASLALGLANGLAQVLPQGLIQTVHPSVGIGTGISRFIGTAVPAMVAGFAGAGLVGLSPMAAAVGSGLDIALASLVILIPIAGASVPSPSTGVGFGVIL